MTSSAFPVCFFFLSVLLCSVLNAFALQRCEVDHECLKGYFCYKSGRCTSCLDCSIYNRKPSEVLKCSKHPLECGYCLLGYEEESFKGGAKRELCIRKNEPEPKFSLEYALISGVVIVVIGALFAGLVCVYKKYRNQINRDNPKLQQSNSPSRNNSEDNSRQSNTSSRNNIEVICEHPSQAIPLLGNRTLVPQPECPPPYVTQEKYNPEYFEPVRYKSIPWSSAPPEHEVITHYGPSIQIEKEIQCRAVPFTPYNENYSSEGHLHYQNENIHRPQSFNDNYNLYPSAEEDSQEELSPRTIDPPDIEEDTQQSHWRPVLETNSTQTTNEGAQPLNPEHEHRFRSLRRPMGEMESCGQCSEHCPRNHDDTSAKRLCTETNDCQQTDCLDSPQNEISLSNISENSPNIEEPDIGDSPRDNFNDILDD